MAALLSSPSSGEKPHLPRSLDQLKLPKSLLHVTLGVVTALNAACDGVDRFVGSSQKSPAAAVKMEVYSSDLLPDRLPDNLKQYAPDMQKAYGAAYEEIRRQFKAMVAARIQTNEFRISLPANFPKEGVEYLATQLQKDLTAVPVTAVHDPSQGEKTMRGVQVTAGKDSLVITFTITDVSLHPTRKRDLFPRASIQHPDSKS